MGEVVGSIGEDGRCKLWQEDPAEVPMSNSRFKLVANISSQTNVPFMSMDFKNIMQETWLALITRDGFLTVYEPTDQSTLHEWSVIAEHWICDPPPERQEEVGFKVVFHKEKLPCWTAIMAGLDRKSLSLAVAAMNDVFVYRTDKMKRFYRVATLSGARQIIRDVAWANGSMRGYDIIATASKDGSIRMYEVSTPRTEKDNVAHTGGSSGSTVTETMSSPRPSKNAPSGIGAGLAGISKAPDSAQDENQPGRIRQLSKMTDELTNHHGAVWRVTFSQMGKFVCFRHNSVLIVAQAIFSYLREMTLLSALGRRLSMGTGLSMPRSRQHAIVRALGCYGSSIMALTSGLGFMAAFGKHWVFRFASGVEITLHHRYPATVLVSDIESLHYLLEGTTVDTDSVPQVLM